MRRHAKASVVVAVLFAFLAFAGSALAGYPFKGTFAGPGTGNGQLETPGRAAVEQSSGNLFVVDSGTNRVQVFKPNGADTADYLTKFGESELSAPWGIAIDEDAGQTSVYIADAGNEAIVKYDSDEQPSPSFTVDPDFTSPAKGAGAGEIEDFHAALAIDPTTHDLLVADNTSKRISRFEADGTPDGSFDGSAGSGSPGAFAGPIDLAVNSEGDIYVIDAMGNVAEQGGTSKALRYSDSGEYKSTLPSVGTHERVATVAVNPFDDSVVVSGDQDNVYEGGPPPFQPVLGLFDADDNPLPSPTLNASAQYDTVAGLAIASDTADHLYVVLDKAYYNGDHATYGTIQIQAFRNAHPSAPSVVNASASPTFNEAILRATINSGNTATKYRFEYGPTASYRQSTSIGSVSASEEDVEASAPAVGLTPGTTYHYRVVVENSVSDAQGADGTFTTKTRSKDGATCPNEVFRSGLSAILPDCRAYEKVSPSFKNGTDIAGFRGVSTRSSASGDRVVFSSVGGFSDYQDSVYAFTQYLGSRASNAWNAAGIAPAVEVSPSVFESNVAVQGFSEELDSFIVKKFDPPLTADAMPHTVNVYLSKPGAGSYTNLTPSGPTDASELQFYNPEFAAGSADFSHIIFESDFAMVPGAVTGALNLYEWSDGETRLVGIMPNGDPAPGGSVAGPAEFSVGSGEIEPPALAHPYTETAISRDGSRIFWTEVATGQIYVRIDGSATKAVSETQRTNDTGSNGADPLGTQRPNFRQATPDGAVAYFISSEKLTNDATADAGQQKADLYAYEVASGKLTDLSIATQSGESADVLGVLGTSDDGSYVYFAARGELGGDAVAGQANVYLWHAGEVSYVTTLPQSSSVDEAKNWAANVHEGGDLKSSRVTPDGNTLVLTSQGSLSDYDANGTRQVYRFDAVDRQLWCISCNLRVPQAAGSASVAAPHEGTDAAFRAFLPRWLSDDGSRVFFNTPEALVPQDSNGKVDVYEWEDGDVQLISSGQSATNSYFTDASTSGGDVFFLTRQRLLASDIDDNVDLYDARTNGGFAEAGSAVSCSGEDCQPGGEAAPASRTPGSSTVRGNGNAKARQHPRCAKAKKGKARKGRARCVKKPGHTKKHKRAGRGRGGSK